MGLGTSETEEVSRGSRASRWFGKTSEQPEPAKPVQSATSDLSVKQDAARSLLEMLQKGSSQSSDLNKKILTAEELERGSGTKFF